MIYNWQKFNENEYTALAAKLYLPSIDRERRFTGPSDNDSKFGTTLRYCTITFPDDVVINFDIISENYNDDINTIKLGARNRAGYHPIETSLSSEYLKLFGDRIQFEDFNAYRMIRLYMNRVDLFDTPMDGYIYDPDKLGATEVNIHIDLSNDSDLPMRFLRNGGVFGSNIDSHLYALSSANYIIDKNKSWRNYFRENKDETLQKFIDPIDNISVDTPMVEIKPCHVFSGKIGDISKGYIKMDGTSGVGLCGYLYLYGILNGFTKSSIFVLKNYSKDIRPSLILDALYEMI